MSISVKELNKLDDMLDILVMNKLFNIDNMSLLILKRLDKKRYINILCYNLY